MSTFVRRTAVVLASGVLLATSALFAAPGATADTAVTLTPAQLTESGFPRKPNTVAWNPGTASVPTTTAPQWEDVIITGTAPSYAPVGQILTLERFVPTSTTGDGSFKTLNITTTVQKNRSFSMHFQLGLSGTYGYRVGYETSSFSPEFVGFQFQFTTTGTGQPAPGAGQSTAVALTPRQLTKAGFSKTVNTTAWGATATLSAEKVPAGAPVTIKGTAPEEIRPGTVLQLKRFVPTDKYGSGSFEAIPGALTQVATDRTFSLTFEINQRGVYGYSLGAVVGDEWVGMEFQLKTT